MQLRRDRLWDNVHEIQGDKEIIVDKWAFDQHPNQTINQQRQQQVPRVLAPQNHRIARVKRELRSNIQSRRVGGDKDQSEVHNQRKTLF